MLYQELKKISVNTVKLPQLLYSYHHYSHAASAFYPSPFENAGILCTDRVGEWTTTSAWSGKGNKLTPLGELKYPHSLGLLYSSFTYYIGFKVNSGEYKLMGLAPYGKPIYKNLILDNLIDLKNDGAFKLNMEYFSYGKELKLINNKFCDLFGNSLRKPEGLIQNIHLDLASSIQEVCEEVVLRLARTIFNEVNQENLCLAGGVALNCVANGKILKSIPFKNIWIQPAAGDSGGAVGAAWSTWFTHLNNSRKINKDIDKMKGALLGPEFDINTVKKRLMRFNAVYKEFSEQELSEVVAKLLSQGNIIGWFQGKMEYGPRALGCKSILGDPRDENMQSTMNLKIKFRESFRPFAPAIKKECVNDIFDLNSQSPYMLIVSKVKQKYLLNNDLQEKKSGIEQLKVLRSLFPAITHIDNSARIQTVDKDDNYKFYNLLNEFDRLTGCPILINTSFNVRGEPIVCTPEEAYICFMRTGMDYLVIDNLLFKKELQTEMSVDLYVNTYGAKDD